MIFFLFNLKFKRSNKTFFFKLISIAFERNQKISDSDSNTAYYRAIESNYNLDQRIVRDTIRVTGTVYIVEQYAFSASVAELVGTSL